MAAERSDTLIGDDVVRTLGAQGRSSQVLVQVQDGHVTLSGDVPDAETKQQVQAQVAAIEGVRGVRNHLNVDGGERSFGPRGRAVRDNPEGEDAPRMGDIDLDGNG
ncbi:BON domain-containing protein [Stenotrophomonas sp. MYb238]|uniref:BON domain-containing protein n=1 Tax=Stenotrophomonas sp. MYb238 TaxID=2040281 RepID=UPI0018855390|nr:BON domain-containing protein [Stenotrophomonas sp. MYb238]